MANWSLVMWGLLNHLTACLILILLAAIAHAEGKPPDQRPFLRIEAGMHTAIIKRIALSADGKLMATGSQDKTARLWSLPDGQLIRTFRVPITHGHGGEIYAVALSPSGRLLAAAGWDAQGRGRHFIHLFDTLSGALLLRLGPMPDVINDIEFSPTGSVLAAGVQGPNGVYLWRAPFTGAAVADKRYGDSVYGLAFSRDGRRLAVTAYDGKVRLYDFDASGKRLKPKAVKRAQGGAQPYGIAWSPDDTRLAIGYADTVAVDVLDAVTLDRLYGADTGFATNGNLGRVAWSYDGAALFAGGIYDRDGINPLIAWSHKGSASPRILGGPSQTIMDIAPLREGGFAWGASDPAFGVFGIDDRARLMRSPVTADMRGKHSDRFKIAPSAMGVWFGLDANGTEPWLFDMARLTFAQAPVAPQDFIEPNTTALAIRDWLDSPTASFGDMVLRLAEGEWSRSLAIAPDGRSFALGTDYALHLFDERGRERWRRETPSVAWGLNRSADGAIVLAALGDGTIRWYRAGDGEELLAFFVHVPDKRWIAWTPSGYYAASPGGEDLIGWHVNGRTWDEAPQFYPASRFRDRYYRPDIVRLVLKTKDEAEAVEQADAEAGKREEAKAIEELLPATVELVLDAAEIETDKQQITVRYRLASPTGRPVTKVEARIDGRPVETRGMLRVAVDYPLGEVLEAEVTVPPRDTELSIIAYIGEQPSVAARVPVKWIGAAAEAKKPKLYALLVGVSAYEDKKLALNYAAKDARDFAEAIKAQEGRLYSAVEIATLLDGEATKSAVETALALLKKKAGPDDVVIVFLAGHGITDKALDFYFLTANANFDPDLFSANALDGAILRKELAKVQGRVVLFMDACRAGAGIQGAVDMSRVSNDFALDTGGLVMFASSQGDVDSIESPIWENGAFTEALLAVLADPQAYGTDKMLSLPELEEALTTRVAELTENRQLPVMTKYGAIPRFFIAAAR